MARTRGSGEVFPWKGSWSCRWRENGRRRFRGGFPSRDDAARWLKRKQGELSIRRTGIIDSRSAPTLAGLAADYLEQRKLTNPRTYPDDLSRWNKHLLPLVGHLRPGEVDRATVRRVVLAMLAKKLRPGTVRLGVVFLSGLFVDLEERRLALDNPWKGLPPTISRLVRPDHDPKTTPFLERLEDVRRVYLALAEKEERIGVAFAIGALGGLRTGEVLALRWPGVNLETQRIHVTESVEGPLKDKDSRVVPIQDALLPVLRAWRVKSGGDGLVVPPAPRKGARTVDQHTPGAHLRAALKRLGIMPEHLGHRWLWYVCTRHTFASHWAMAGRDLTELQKILGHSSIKVTERYAHLRPDFFRPGATAALEVDLSPAGGEVRRLRGPENGHPESHPTAKRSRKHSA